MSIQHQQIEPDDSTPKYQVEHAVKVINETYRFPAASLIDWTDVDDGYAINVEESGLDAYDVSINATVHGALPRGTFLEPINEVALRLVRA